MDVERVSVPSRLLGCEVTVGVVPTVDPDACRKWTWLLHGRDATVDELTSVLSELGDAMEAGSIAPQVLAAPHAPFNDGSSWWVDSRADDGLPVESAMLGDVLPAVETKVLGHIPVAARYIGGWSMGGAAALRWLRVRPDLFSGAALVAPAVYADLPPIESSARRCGAFGEGDRVWVERRWRQLMAPDLAGGGTSPPEVVTVAGDDEPIERYESGPSSLTEQAARLHVVLRGQGVRSHLRVVSGGHEDSFWAPAFATALAILS